MDKLYGLRKLMKVLYPGIYFIIRMKKNNNYEIIVKGVKHIEYNPLTFHRILVMKNNKEVINKAAPTNRPISPIMLCELRVRM